jgi:chromosomal replication initiator protein
MNGSFCALIQEEVAGQFKLPMTKLLGRGRYRRVCRPRQIAMYLACEMTGQSLPQIGRSFGRDHTTVLHARRTIANLIERDAYWADQVDQARARVTFGMWSAG